MHKLGASAREVVSNQECALRSRMLHQNGYTPAVDVAHVLQTRLHRAIARVLLSRLGGAVGKALGNK